MIREGVLLFMPHLKLQSIRISQNSWLALVRGTPGMKRNKEKVRPELKN